MDDKLYVLIVAGGSGKRMNPDIPKQFMEIQGKPLLMQTFEPFLRFNFHCQFIVVLPEEHLSAWKKLCIIHSFTASHEVVPGGHTRFHSVQNGLNSISQDGIVFIHDGVRPLVSQHTLENCFLLAREKGNALPVISPSESVREIHETGNRAVNRDGYCLVQTPQTFRVSLIKKAYQQVYRKKYTDDASVLEDMGVKINLAQGNRENIKITYPSDLKIASALFNDIGCHR